LTQRSLNSSDVRVLDRVTRVRLRTNVVRRIRRRETIQRFVFSLSLVRITQPHASMPNMQSASSHNKKRIRHQVVYLVRHAEAAHNIMEKQAIQEAIAKGIHGKEEHEEARRAVLNHESLRDAPLSQEGNLQVMRKSRSLTMLSTLGGSKYSSPTLVLVSPLRRALMTATKLFPQKQHVPKFVALEILREKRTGFAADERSSVEILEKEFPHVDFSDLRRNDRPAILAGEDNAAVRARGKAFLEGTFSQLEEESVALVTHKGWLRELRQTLRSNALAGDLEVNFDLDDWHQTLYKNAEVRVADFAWEGSKLKSIVSKSVDNAMSSVIESAFQQISQRGMDDIRQKKFETMTCIPCIACTTI
jgi:broad specificity phosphatase PhoE